ncbi:hypothetical protein [Actinacidiphila glaucinigra]|uniref:hypothetical protein n=1 Tax=Actinacidiphila glaucinigra TaxID=235986 RepID=UPI00380A8B2A
MPKTLIGSPDADQPPFGPALSDEHAERVVPHLMAGLRPTLPPMPMRGFLTDDT